MDSPHCKAFLTVNLTSTNFASWAMRCHSWISWLSPELVLHRINCPLTPCGKGAGQQCFRKYARFPKSMSRGKNPYSA
eukprot:1162064-Pelagomonas_calceolata.AAC.6